MVRLTLNLGSTYRFTSTVRSALPSSITALIVYRPMLISSASVNSADTIPNFDASIRFLKTLLPFPSSTSSVTASPAAGAIVGFRSASARRCIVWPGW